LQLAGPAGFEGTFLPICVCGGPQLDPVVGILWRSNPSSSTAGVRTIWPPVEIVMVASRPTCDVLIVDDDRDCVEALRYLLEDRGYRVDIARNGLQALEYFESGGRPRIVILDLLMPVMDGLEFLNRRRENPVLAETPVIVLTATDARLNTREETVLRKPVDFGVLVEKIEEACGPMPGRGSARTGDESGSDLRRT
jgi:CheY-like chemotaxis protein